MDTLHYKTEFDISSFGNGKIVELVYSEAEIKKIIDLYLQNDFFPSAIILDPITKEPKFEINVSDNQILLRDSLENLNLLLKENLITLADYRKCYTSLKDKFEIICFICGQLEEILSIDKFEEVSYKNQDKDQIVKRNIQKLEVLTNKLVEMLSLGFMDKKMHGEAQKILMKIFASSDKRNYNLYLN
jgi:hypothetical protein